MWKWNLAFQCVVNIGVRGSEVVRTRVVEADMVPVIATILNNYITVIDRCREKAEAAKNKSLLESRHHKSGEHRNAHKATSFGNRPSRFDAEHRSSRRHPPPPSIDVSATFTNPPLTGGTDAMDITPTGPQFAMTSPPERTTFNTHRHHHHHHHRHGGRDNNGWFANSPRHGIQPLATAVPPMDTPDGFGLRPVRDAERLPSMLPGFHGGITSQPESPTTPLAPNQLRSPTVRPTSLSNPIRSRRRPSIRQQVSTAAESEDMNGDSMASDESGEPEISGIGNADIQTTTVNIQDVSMDEGESMLASVETPLGLTTPTVSETQDAGTFNITHRSAMNDATTPTGPTMGISPAQPTATIPPPTMPNATIPRYLLDRPQPSSGQVLAGMPRDEDVLMSLQLLAYVSKYCNLRSYFQNSHLVPKLKIGSELHLLESDDESTRSFASHCASSSECEEEDEYLLPDDFNIFPLVEKFTVRHHNQDMQYWAGVVMRNLCRKDDSRGGIRQCAYYRCGKWEEFTRQFAKCRRCRRTKYCSKECQKSAWVFHRHWCVAATQ